jgi:hypothetical protein
VLLDAEQPRPQRRFVHGHELGHHALPWHQDAFYGDDHRTLDPDTHEELEAEANAFSAELLLNIDAFTERAHATMLGLDAMPPSGPSTPARRSHGVSCVSTIGEPRRDAGDHPASAEPIPSCSRTVA